jgi:gluconolactonase
MASGLYARTVLAGTVAVVVCSAASPIQPHVVARDVTWQEVSRSGLSSSEGVVAAGDGWIYLTEIPHLDIKSTHPNGTIWRFDPVSGRTEKYLEPSGNAIGLHVDRNGDLILAQAAMGGGRAIVRRNLKTRTTVVVVDSYQGKRLNSPNDVTSDARGRIYFTDARYFGDEPMELPNAIYRVDPDGRFELLSIDIYRPNGIEVSPDGRRLYVSASNLKERLATNPAGPLEDKFGLTLGGVVAYDLDGSGNVANGRVFYRRDDLLTDGMAMDAGGHLYVAAHNSNRQPPRSEVVVLNPRGEVVATMRAPEGVRASNVGFGRGKDSSSLYVTNLFTWRLFRIKTERRGHYFE